MFDFVRSIGLRPIEWSEAVGLTAKGAPFVGEVLDAAVGYAQGRRGPPDSRRDRLPTAGVSERLVVVEPAVLPAPPGI